MSFLVQSCRLPVVEQRASGGFLYPHQLAVWEGGTSIEHAPHGEDGDGQDPCGDLYQDGEPTPVSDLMRRENHIFAVVPKRAVEDDLDRRLPVFESGAYIIAFDGAALLLLELARRTAEA